jgi:hypothetical protein
MIHLAKRLGVSQDNYFSVSLLLLNKLANAGGFLSFQPDEINPVGKF